MKLLTALVLPLLLVGCSAGGSSVAGTWRIEQDGAGFGEGADKIEMKLGDDMKYDISAGPLKMFEGTYTFAENKLTLSAAGGSLGTEYRLDNGKILPVIGGKDVTFWRWVRK